MVRNKFTYEHMIMVRSENGIDRMPSAFGRSRTNRGALRHTHYVKKTNGRKIIRLPVASLIGEVNPGLVKRQLETNGRLANLGLTY